MRAALKSKTTAKRVKAVFYSITDVFGIAAYIIYFEEVPGWRSDR